MLEIPNRRKLQTGSQPTLISLRRVQSARRAMNTLTTQLNSTQLPVELSWVGRSEQGFSGINCV